MIEPKSRAVGAPSPACHPAQLPRGEMWPDRAQGELVFGRTVDQAFYASTVDGRAKRALATANDHEREAPEAASREPDPLRLITLHEVATLSHRC